MAGLKPMTRMTDLNRLGQLDDVRALKGGSLFEDDGAALQVPEPPPIQDVFTTSEEEDELALIHRRIGGRQSDLQLSKRILGWKQSEIPNATIPESIVYDYLKMGGRPFIYQHYVWGGRSAKGGVVPDFLVESGGEWMVWNVQGEYWHSEAINEGKDGALRFRLLGQIIMGLKVGAVVELWESDLYNERPAIWMLAWAGRGMRQ